MRKRLSFLWLLVFILSGCVAPVPTGTYEICAKRDVSGVDGLVEVKSIDGIDFSDSENNLVTGKITFNAIGEGSSKKQSQTFTLIRMYEDGSAQGKRVSIANNSRFTWLLVPGTYLIEITTMNIVKPGESKPEKYSLLP